MEFRYFFLSTCKPVLVTQLNQAVIFKELNQVESHLYLITRFCHKRPVLWTDHLNYTFRELIKDQAGISRAINSCLRESSPNTHLGITHKSARTSTALATQPATQYV